MAHPVWIPSDEEAGGLKERNANRRTNYWCTCILCKEDYDVRDGGWITAATPKGTKIDIKVCSDCFIEEKHPTGA